MALTIRLEVSDRMAQQNLGDQIDQICDEFEQAWKQNDAPDVQSWMHRVEAPERQRLLKALVEVDIEYRTRLDRKFDATQYLENLGLSSQALAEDLTVSDLGTLGSDPTITVKTSVLMPSRIGKYQLQQEVGRGGFGVVYRAFDTVLKRDVALKIPRDFLHAGSKLRFVQEAEAAAALDHPGVVTVFESGEADGHCYIASAFCEGQNLSYWMKAQGEISSHCAAQIIRDAADAMQHAHDRGVIHRDLKPGNIMAVPGSDGTILPRITDFGLAKLIEGQMEDTRTSIVLGTPSYMAPEQIISDSTSQESASDIYSLGVILYELLTGQRPFERSSVIEVMDAIRRDPVVSPRKIRADIPRDLETICQKCLSRIPEDRYDSCQDLMNDLTSFLSGDPIAARPPGLPSRIRRWLGRPGRFQETGLLSMLLGLLVPVWILMVVVFVAIDRLEANIKSELIPQTLGVTVSLLLPLAWVGWKTLGRSRLWVWIGFFASLINVVMVVPPLFGHIVVFPELYGQYPLGRIVAYTFLTLLFSVQVVQYGCLLRFTKPAQGGAASTVM